MTDFRAVPKPDGTSTGYVPQNSNVRDLYLRLLKRSLTNTLFSIEPDADDKLEMRYVDNFINHYMQGPAVSMLPLVRFDNLQNCIIDIIERKVPGDLIETGVWRGGAAIFMRAMLKIHAIADRTVWIADSFEGLPSPDAEKYPLEAKAHAGPVLKKAFKHFEASVDEVRRNFEAYDMLDGQVRFLKGWFRDTLPNAPIDSLAVMRLDGDYYESTMDALVNLYDKLSVGGYAIIDDYGEQTWTYCRRAVDEFRQARGITDPLVKVDSKCYFWKRTGP
jgi:hypothetical protein